MFKEICPVCQKPTDDHGIEMLIECIEKNLKTWDNAVKKLPHWNSDL